jgi:hypothetical protein
VSFKFQILKIFLLKDDAFAVVVYNHNSGGFANVGKHTIFYGVTIGKRIAKKRQ